MVVTAWPATVEIGRTHERTAWSGRLEALLQRFPVAPAEPSAAVPPCPIHHRPMKQSAKRPNSYFCTARLEDGAYCSEKRTIKP